MGLRRRWGVGVGAEAWGARRCCLNTRGGWASLVPTPRLSREKTGLELPFPGTWAEGQRGLGGVVGVVVGLLAHKWILGKRC